MKVSFFLLDADYVEDKRRGEIAVRLFGRDKRGRTIIACCDYLPNFYVLPARGSEEKAKKEIERVLKSAGIEAKRIEMVRKKLYGDERKVIKITCGTHGAVTKARDAVKLLEERRGGSGSVVEEYEYAINPYRKFLLERAINGSCWLEAEGELIAERDGTLMIKASCINAANGVPELSILAFDIECYETNGEQKVVMISLYGCGSREGEVRKVITTLEHANQSYVERVATEKELLERFAEYVNRYDPDVIATFNGDGFDFPVLEERAEKNKVELNLSRGASEVKFVRRARQKSARIGGRFHFDVFQFVNNILSPNLQTEVLSLDAVSSELLGDRKIEIDYQEMLDAIRKKRDLTKLAAYCLKDSELTYRLAKLLLPQVIGISQTVGQILFDVSRMTYGQLVEWYLMRKAAERNEIIPNQPKFEEIQRRRAETYTGGFVKEPIAGLHENIAVVDFKSLYPSIVATFNISPETVDCDCCREGKKIKVPETSHHVCTRRRGFVSSVINELIEKRSEIKSRMKNLDKHSTLYKTLDNQQYALKIIANACYGMFGFAGARWYCKACAESITAFGRDFIKKIINLAQERGFVAIYGDTDSCFLKSEKESGKAFESKVYGFLREVNENLPGVMKLELQGFYKRGIFIPRGMAPGTAKKRYALIDFDDRLLVRGLETVRRDWCNLAKEVQRNVLLYILRDKDVNKAITYVRGVVSRLRKKDVKLKDLVIYEQLTKPINEYRQISPHVIAARKMLERGEVVGEGSVIMFVITKKGKSISDKAEPVEHVSINDIDENYYIEHQILPAALRVLSVLGIDETHFKERGLERFLR